eukprot:g362.t1
MASLPSGRGELATYAKSLEQSMDDLRARKQDLETRIQVEEQLRARTQQDISRLRDRVNLINASLSKKNARKKQYDELHEETSAVYDEIYQTSNKLLQMVQKRKMQLSSDSGGV